MSNWFDIREAQRRQEEIAERMQRIEHRTAEEAEAEAAAAKNNKPKIWNGQDFQIALNAFTRYQYNKNDGEWARWSRDVREKHE
jgi:hypothetical protein